MQLTPTVSSTTATQGNAHENEGQGTNAHPPHPHGSSHSPHTRYEAYITPPHTSTLPARDASHDIRNRLTENPAVQVPERVAGSTEKDVREEVEGSRPAGQVPYGVAGMCGDQIPSCARQGPEPHGYYRDKQETVGRQLVYQRKPTVSELCP